MSMADESRGTMSGIGLPSMCSSGERQGYRSGDRAGGGFQIALSSGLESSNYSDTQQWGATTIDGF